MHGVIPDRRAAGLALAERLRGYTGRDDVIVLALPRGGVPVGYELARALGVPLAVFGVRKLGVPGQEELAFGAVAAGGTVVINRALVDALGLPVETVERAIERELAELDRRAEAWNHGRTPSLRGRTAILVDDGLATGSTMLAAIGAVAQQQPGRVVVAVPVAALEVRDEVASRVDELVCLLAPSPFQAVGLWYEDFRPVDDDEVRELLRAAESVQARPPGSGGTAATSRPDGTPGV